MGLREATIITFLLGAISVVAAAEPDKAGKPPSRDPGARPAPSPDDRAELPDPAADADAAPDADEQDAEVPPHLEGPKLVQLGNGIEIDLPAGFFLLERAEAQERLRKRGDPPEGTLAIVGSFEGNWELDIDYADAGYIDDSDAEELDADDLLDQFQKGTVKQNEKRKAMGVPELIIDGWSEKPRYERILHHLVFGVTAHNTRGKVINFSRQILGRNGFVALVLLCAPEDLETAKQQAAPIFTATRFKPGVRYADHTSDDRSAGIGLRGLVLGGAGVAVASKLGFLAKLLLGLKKGLVLIVLVVGAAFRRLFRRPARSSESPVEVAAPPPDDPASGGSSPG